MTQVVLDKDWMISIDGFGNHVPHHWKEICKRVEGGGPRDSVPTGEYEWNSENKYFPNMLQALQYIFQKNLLDNVDVIKIEDYCQLVKEVADYFDEKLGGT